MTSRPSCRRMTFKSARSLMDIDSRDFGERAANFRTALVDCFDKLAEQHDHEVRANRVTIKRLQEQLDAGLPLANRTKKFSVVAPSSGSSDKLGRRNLLSVSEAERGAGPTRNRSVPNHRMSEPLRADADRAGSKKTADSSQPQCAPLYSSQRGERLPTLSSARGTFEPERLSFSADRSPFGGERPISAHGDRPSFDPTSEPGEPSAASAEQAPRVESGSGLNVEQPKLEERHSRQSFGTNRHLDDKEDGLDYRSNESGGSFGAVCPTDGSVLGGAGDFVQTQVSQHQEVRIQEDTPAKSKEDRQQEAIVKARDQDESETDESEEDANWDIFVLRQSWREVDEKYVDMILKRTAAFSNRSTTMQNLDKVFNHKSEGIRTPKGFQNDESEQLHINGWAIHPQSRRRLAWDIVAMILLLYDLIMTPLQVFELPDDLFFYIVDLIILVYWTFDMPASALTAYYLNGRLETELSTILKRYFRGWFPFDILILCPGWMTFLAGDDSSTNNPAGLARAFRGARFLRFLRFLRLLRLVKVEKVLQDLKTRVNSNYVLLCMNVTKLMLCLTILIHVLACAWYLVGKESEEGWVHIHNLSNQDFGQRYLFSFQWSMARLHPSTFGENLQLKTVRERLFAIGVSLVALGGVLKAARKALEITQQSSHANGRGGGVFISSITNTMAELQALRRQRNRKLYVIREYVREHDISAALSVRVKKYVERSLSRKLREQHAAELISMVPTPLLMDLHFEAWSPYISNHVFFNKLCHDYSRVVYNLCRDAFQESPVHSGDTVFSTGDICSRMLFVLRGALTYVLGGNFDRKCVTEEEEDEDVGRRDSRRSSNRKDSGGGRSRLAGIMSRSKRPPQESSEAEEDDEEEHARLVVEKVIPGQWVSEAVLWTVWENQGELGVRVDSTILALSEKEFVTVVRKHERAYIDVANYAKQFVQMINNSSVTLTDLVMEAEDRDKQFSVLNLFQKKEGAAMKFGFNAFRRPSNPHSSSTDNLQMQNLLPQSAAEKSTTGSSGTARIKPISENSSNESTGSTSGQLRPAIKASEKGRVLPVQLPSTVHESPESSASSDTEEETPRRRSQEAPSPTNRLLCPPAPGSAPPQMPGGG